MKLNDFNADYFDDGSVCDSDIILEAKKIIDDQLIKTIPNMAAYMVADGCSNTMSGNRQFSFSGLAEIFNVSVDWIKEHEEDIETAIRCYSQVVDDGDGVWIYDEDGDRYFDLNFFTGYCALEED